MSIYSLQGERNNNLITNIFMNKVKFSLFALVAMFAASCVADPTIETSANLSAEELAAKKREYRKRKKQEGGGQDG